MFIEIGANLNTQEAYIYSVLTIYGIHVENRLVLYFCEEPLVLVIKQTNYKSLGVQVPHTNAIRNWVLFVF